MNSKIDLAWAVELRQRGWTQRQIAEEFGVTPSAISMRVRRAGLGQVRQGRPVGFYVTDQARAVKLYRSGLSLRQTATKLGCGYTAVFDALVRAGVERRPRGGRRDGDSTE
jgi:transposase